MKTKRIEKNERKDGENRSKPLMARKQWPNLEEFS
jgi:hypothetical protein